MGARKLSYHFPFLRDYKEIAQKKLELISRGDMGYYFYSTCPVHTESPRYRTIVSCVCTHNLARMYRDNTTAYGTASGGYGKTGAQSPAIVIQHSSGSYKYVNGEWWHRIILYKDSMYVPVTNSNNIPIEVLNQISK